MTTSPNTQLNRTGRSAALFEEIVDSILSGSFEIVDLVKKTYHACGLAGWVPQQEEFRLELEGYPKDVELPAYRRGLSAELKWVPASIYDVPAYIATRQVYGESEVPEPTTVDCWAALEQLLGWSDKGVSLSTGERRDREVGSGTKTAYEKQVLAYHANGFQKIVTCGREPAVQV